LQDPRGYLLVVDDRRPEIKRQHSSQPVEILRS
jgi:hypothetical protein